MFHDDQLVGIRLRADQHEALIDVKSEGGISTIRLKGVERFLAHGLRQGNIILFIEMLEGEAGAALRQVSDEEIVIDLIEEAGTPFFEQTMHRISRREIGFFLLRSSYGPDIGALCAEFVVEPGNCVQ